MQSGKHKTSSSTNALLRTLACILLTLCVSAKSVVATESTATIRIAILPCSEIVKTYIQAQPLQTYLSHQLNRQIEIIVPNSYQEFKRTIHLGETEFAFQAPHAYLLLAHQYDPRNLLKALTPQGTSVHRGVVVTRKDSGLEKIEDLHGKKFLFGHPFSTAKWLAPKALLEGKGIDLTNDLQSYSHGDSCEAIAMNVYLGQADAGAICDYSFAELAENSSHEEDEVPPDALVIIGTTWEIPTWVFASRKGVDAETVTRMVNALTALDRRRPEHREVLESLELGGFVKARDTDYDSLRKHLAETDLPSQ